jgi:hypothetical protein
MLASWITRFASAKWTTSQPQVSLPPHLNSGPAQCPGVDDILRTRLTTLGVEEHRLTLEGGQIEQRHREWIIYDVGGSRTQRGKYVRVHGLFMPTSFQ